MYLKTEKLYSGPSPGIKVTDGTPDEFWYYFQVPYFDEKEIGDFEQYLKKFRPEDRDHFLKKLADLCYSRKHMDETGAAGLRREEAKKVLKHLRKTEAILNLLAHSRLSARPHLLACPRLFEDVYLRPNNSVNPETDTPFFDIEQDAKKSREGIKQLIGRIESAFPKGEAGQGRNKADSTGFGLAIANLYFDCFRELPSRTPEGSYFGVVKQALRVIGLPFENPLRVVQDAINKQKRE